MGNTAISVLANISKHFMTRPGKGHSLALLSGAIHAKKVKIIVASKKSAESTFSLDVQRDCIPMTRLDQVLAGYDGPMLIDNEVIIFLGEQILCEYKTVFAEKEKAEQRYRIVIIAKQRAEEEKKRAESQIEQLIYENRVLRATIQDDVTSINAVVEDDTFYVTSKIITQYVLCAISMLMVGYCLKDNFMEHIANLATVTGLLSALLLPTGLGYLTFFSVTGIASNFRRENLESQLTTISRKIMKEYRYRNHTTEN